MTRSSYSRIIRKRPRKVHKFEPILSRMGHCENEVCDECMAAMQRQVDNDRPGHVWAVEDGKIIYMEDEIFVHSPRPGRGITEAYMHDPYWAKHYIGARRIIIQ